MLLVGVRSRNGSHLLDVDCAPDAMCMCHSDLSAALCVSWFSSEETEAQMLGLSSPGG